MPFKSPYNENREFFRIFSGNGSPKAPSVLSIAKDGKFLYVFSPIFVIWSFISPTGGEKKNIFSIFRHLRSENSNWGVRGEKIINFHVLVEKRLSILQQVVKRKIFFSSVEKRFSNVQPGGEDTQQPRKEVHR